MWLAGRVRAHVCRTGTRPCGGLQRSTSSSARTTAGGASGGEVRPQRLGRDAASPRGGNAHHAPRSGNAHDARARPPPGSRACPGRCSSSGLPAGSRSARRRPWGGRFPPRRAHASSGARARDELGRRARGRSAAAGTRSSGKGPSARTTDASRSSTGSRSSRTGSQRSISPTSSPRWDSSSKARSSRDVQQTRRAHAPEIVHPAHEDRASPMEAYAKCVSATVVAS